MSIFDVKLILCGESLFFPRVKARSKVNACVQCFEFLRATTDHSEEDFKWMTAVATCVRGPEMVVESKIIESNFPGREKENCMVNV